MHPFRDCRNGLRLAGRTKRITFMLNSVSKPRHGFGTAWPSRPHGPPDQPFCGGKMVDQRRTTCLLYPFND